MERAAGGQDDRRSAGLQFEQGDTTIPVRISKANVHRRVQIDCAVLNADLQQAYIQFRSEVGSLKINSSPQIEITWNDEKTLIQRLASGAVDAQREIKVREGLGVDIG